MLLLVRQGKAMDDRAKGTMEELVITDTDEEEGTSGERAHERVPSALSEASVGSKGAGEGLEEAGPAPDMA